MTRSASLTLDDGFIVLLEYCDVRDVQWREGKLVAWTWGCYMTTLDRSTGTVLESVFTE